MTRFILDEIHAFSTGEAWIFGMLIFVVIPLIICQILFKGDDE